MINLTKTYKIILHIVLSTLLLLITPPLHRVSAENGWSIVIRQTDTGQFPLITFNMQVYDESGAFVSGLAAEDLEVIEDGYSRRINEINQVEPGLQFIAAINEAPTMTNHYGGVSYYNLFFDALVDWAARQPEDRPDDYSLVTNTGVKISRVQGASLYVDALNNYESNVLEQRPSLNSLSQALDLVTDTSENPLGKHALLYITTIPDSESMNGLSNLTARAVQIGVQVSVWLLDPSIASHARQAEPLLQMAEQTGGTFFVLTGGEVFPDLDADLANLRYDYQVRYFSKASTSGEHTFTVNIHHEDTSITSEPQAFIIEVLPPNPILLTPPLQINRTWSAGNESGTEPVLQPDTQLIQILVEFPDGHARDLRFSRLYVDGILEMENSSMPFDSFTWSLESYTTSGVHQVQVEIEDTLGLSQRTIETPVQVAVEELKLPWWESILNSQGWIAMVAILMSAGALLAVMVFTTRRERGKTRRIKQKKTPHSDPLTQPVRASAPTRKIKAQPAPAIEFPVTHRPINPSNAPARLVRLSENETLIEAQTIPLNRKEFTFGRDPQQAICVLDSSSVDAFHARIIQTEEGNFLLSDAGSVAGTWLNYELVPKSGLQLTHGDLIFFGRLAFKFEMINPPGIQQLKISPYKEESL